MDCYDWEAGQRDRGMLMRARSPLALCFVRGRFLGWSPRGNASFSVAPAADCPDLSAMHGREFSVHFLGQGLPASLCAVSGPRRGRFTVTVLCALPPRAWLDEVLS